MRFAARAGAPDYKGDQDAPRLKRNGLGYFKAKTHVEKGFPVSGVSDKAGLPEICQRHGRRTGGRCHQAGHDQLRQPQIFLHWWEARQTYVIQQRLWYCLWPKHWHRDLFDIGSRESLSQPRLFKGLIDDNGHSWRPSTCAQSLLRYGSTPGTHPIQVASIMCNHRNIHVNMLICDLIEGGLATQSTGSGR